MFDHCNLKRRGEIPIREGPHAALEWTGSNDRSAEWVMLCAWGGGIGRKEGREQPTHFFSRFTQPDVVASALLQ